MEVLFILEGNVGSMHVRVSPSSSMFLLKMSRKQMRLLHALSYCLIWILFSLSLTDCVTRDDVLTSKKGERNRVLDFDTVPILLFVSLSTT